LDFIVIIIALQLLQKIKRVMVLFDEGIKMISTTSKDELKQIGKLVACVFACLFERNLRAACVRGSLTD